MLEVNGIEAGYGHLQVLWGISLKVPDGGFVGLLGPNGAGKSTTLRTISGLIKPDKGEIRFMTTLVTGLTTYEISQLGLVFITEELNLFPQMTVRENLLLGAYCVRDAKRIRASLDYVLGLFPVLEEREKQLAGTLSGGERKMLAVGRGFMSDPRLMMVDEPSLGLGPKVVDSIFRALVELNRRGVAILLVEQSVGLALRATHWSYVLEQGRVVLEDASSNLLGNEHVRDAYLSVT